MAEETDVVGRRKDEQAAAACSIASAVLAAPGASEQARELARIVLADGIAMRHDEPREAASIAATFNRHMDAAIDSCNASKHRSKRESRRADLARDLDAAGLILVDKAVMADLLIPRLDAPPAPPPELSLASRFAALDGPISQAASTDAMGRLIGDFMEGATVAAALDPNVND